MKYDQIIEKKKIEIMEKKGHPRKELESEEKEGNSQYGESMEYRFSWAKSKHFFTVDP